MDPVTAIGLLASIATLANVSKGAVDLLRSFKHAERDLAELASGLDLFDEALRGFHRVARSRQARHNISEDIIRKAIDEGHATLSEVQKRLTQVYKSESSTIRRTRFLQYKSRFDALTGKIQVHTTQLNGFISLVHAETFLAACNQNPQLLDACANAVNEVEGKKYLSPEDTAPQLALKKSLSRNSATSEASLGGTTLVNASISSRKGSVASSTSIDSETTLVGDRSRRNSQPQPPDLGSALSRADDRNRLIIRRACRHDCYCRCHDQRSAEESRKGFSRFGARIFHENNQPKSDCSDPSCAGAQTNKPIPVSAFKRAMAQLMSSNNVKIRYRLNTYRMVPEGSNPMRYVKQGNLGKLKMAMQSREATLYDTAPDGWSLLHTAAYARQLDAVQYLIEMGAETDTSDFGARKPVDLAFLKSVGVDATQDDKDIVQLFSKEDDFTLDYEFTPIHIAVLEQYDPDDAERPTLEQLIDFVDNANNAPPGTDWARWKSKYQRRSPLYAAIIEQFRASAIENPSLTNKVIHNLTDQKDRKFHWTPLHWASATGQRAKMKTLVENGADPFIQSNLNFSIIHAAVESNAEETLAYALEISARYPDQLGIDQANVWGETALMMAAQGCRVGCVKLLLQAGADRNARQENGQVALHYAGLSSRAELRRETVSLICDRPEDTTAELDIDAQDEDGRPPIFDFLDDGDCLKILHNHGARLDISDNTGNTVFHHASIQGESKSLKRLLAMIDPDERNNIVQRSNEAGNTALIEALRHENTKCALVLLAFKDMDIGNMVSQDGWAAVHYAAKLGDPCLLKAVLTHPDFVRGLKTDDGKTAKVVAMEFGKWSGEVKDLLNKYNSVM
ncbi:ankyrin repeat protein [Aspergillus filifer]